MISLDKKKLQWSKKKSLKHALELLQHKKVLVGTSDTVPGFLTSVTQEGFHALNQIKQRQGKPYLILISSPEKLVNFIEVPLSEKIQHVIKKYWPGPLTIIFKAQKGLPDFMKSPEEAVAVRIPQHEGLRFLADHFVGLFSTSANKAGNPVPESVADIDRGILEQADGIIINGEIDEKIASEPSTIIDCTQDPIRVIRAGALCNQQFLDDILT